MKSLLFLGCAALVIACGSNSGTATGGTSPLLSSAPQVPQRPSDSIPPANGQAASLNPQQPAINPQQPSANPQTPSIGTAGPGGSAQTGTGCAQLAAAAQAARCTPTNEQLSLCQALTASNSPCAGQIQAVFNCVLRHMACNDNGEVDVGNACDNEGQALQNCLDGATAQCVSPSCSNCADTCATCRCIQATQASLDCSTLGC